LWFPLNVEHRSAQSHRAFVGMTKEVSDDRGMNEEIGGASSRTV
jgi:hypothetical protein